MSIDESVNEHLRTMPTREAVDVIVQYRPEVAAGKLTVADALAAYNEVLPPVRREEAVTVFGNVDEIVLTGSAARAALSWRN